MVVPSIRSIIHMWMHKFSFVPMTLAEAEALEDRIVSPDPDSAQLLKKHIQAGSASLNDSTALPIFDPCHYLWTWYWPGHPTSLAY